jgi:hypothetical protein
MKLFKVLLISLLLTSCSAQWHLNRAIKKDPSILKHKDTVLKIDTVVYTNNYYHEDSFQYTKYDTITYQDTLVKIKLVVKDKTVYMRVEKKSDTIRLKFTRTIRIKTIEKKEDAKFYWLLLLVFVYLLYKLNRK